VKGGDERGQQAGNILCPGKDWTHCLGREIAKVFGQAKLRVELGSGAAGNVQERQEFSGSAPRRTLCDVRRDRYSGPPQLRGETKEFVSWQTVGDTVDMGRQTHGFLPHGQVFMRSGLVRCHRWTVQCGHP